MGMWPRAVRVIPATLLFAAPATAQSFGVVDEATFTITRAGAPFGTETFKIIRRLGANGAEYIAQCMRTTEGRVVRTALTIDSSGNPTSYTRATTGSRPSHITARRAANKLTVNEEGPTASSRDYVFAAGSLILDDDVLHQLYFVTWREPRTIGFVAPAAKTSGQGVLSEVGSESVTVGRTTVPATRYTFGEGDDRREIWIDSRRRLLKVAHPARQLIGTRDQLPR
jgi:hypothetical protein